MAKDDSLRRGMSAYKAPRRHKRDDRSRIQLASQAYVWPPPGPCVAGVEGWWVLLAHSAGTLNELMLALCRTKRHRWLARSGDLQPVCRPDPSRVPPWR